MNKTIVTIILMALALLAARCTQQNGTSFVAGRVVQIADGQLSIAAANDDTLHFSIADSLTHELVLNDSVAIKYFAQAPSYAADVILLTHTTPGLDNVSVMLLGSWQSDSLVLDLRQDQSAQITSSEGSENARWTLLHKDIRFDSATISDLSFTIARVSASSLHLTKCDTTIVFRRLAKL